MPPHERVHVTGVQTAVELGRTSAASGLVGHLPSVDRQNALEAGPLCAFA